MSSTENLKEPEQDPESVTSAQMQEVRAHVDAVDVQVEETATNNDTEEGMPETSPNDPSAPTRRPQTRSQTGTVAKRRTRDDADLLVGSKKRAPATRKRQKTTNDAPANDSASSQTQGSSSPKPPPTREASESSSGSSVTQPSTHTQLTFYHSSLSEDHSECRLPRSRATLPTPIPNLTKKSRGRRVPTKDAGTAAPDQKDDRLYVCTVEGCGKCFHRGEHLKRHIRSIHTHEKPFKCTFADCDKFFNRHDNLLQHLKVHRQANSLPDHPPPVPKRSLEDEHYSPNRHQRSHSPEDEDEDDDEPESPVITPAALPLPTGPRTIYNAHKFPTTSSYNTFSAAPVVYGTSATRHSGGISSSNIGQTEPISLVMNMAVSSLRTEVSSLRTELPRSPVEMRAGATAMQSRPY